MRLSTRGRNVTRPLVILSLLGTIAASTGGCGELFDSTPGPVAIDTRGDTVLIQDRTGKRWDVTHASVYGLKANGFEFGLGPFAIRPIMAPQMLSSGDSGYPRDGDRFRVLAATIGESSRAYSIAHLSRHEVANEVFGEAHVAVAY